MRKRAKRLLICAATLLLVLVVVFILSVPQQYFAGDEPFEIHRIVYRDFTNHETVITEDISAESLTSLLKTVECKRYRVLLAPHLTSVVRYEIDGRYHQEPTHIILGDAYLNIIYNSADKGGYQILDSDDLLAAMDELNPQK